MPDNTGQESFDFSNPFTQTVEVEAKSKKTVDADSSFHEKFEAAKQADHNTSNHQDSAYRYDKNDPRTDRRRNKYYAHKPTPGAGQWLVTFVLLGSLCAVSIFALINYKQNQTILADAARLSKVAGAKSSSLYRVVGKNFTIELQSSLPRDFIITSGELQNVKGLPGQFFVQKVTALSSTKQTGLVVYSKEQIDSQSDESLTQLLSERYGSGFYQYPLSGVNSWKKLAAKTTDTPVALVMANPDVYIKQTATQLYIVESYNQVDSLKALPEQMLAGMRLN